MSALVEVDVVRVGVDISSMASNWEDAAESTAVLLPVEEPCE